MADTPNTSNPLPQSPNQANEAKDLIEQLKIKLKLEGDYGDKIRDSIKDAQKAIKDQIISAAKIKEIGRDTINIVDANNDIYRTKIKQYSIDIKLGDLEKSLGGEGSKKIKEVEKYNKLIEKRVQYEEELQVRTNKTSALQDKGGKKLKSIQEELIKLSDEEAKKQEEYEKAKSNFDEIEKKQSLDIKFRNKDERDSYKKTLAAQMDLAQRAQTQALEDLETVKNKNGELDKIYKSQFKSYVLAAEKEKKAKDELNDLEKDLSIKGASLSVDQIAYAQALKTAELYAVQRKEQEAQLKLEILKSRQLGISGNLFKIFSDKLGFGTEIYSAMTNEATKLVEKNGKVGMFFGKLKVIGAGIGAMYRSIGRNITDPAVLATALYNGVSKTISTAASFANKMTGTGGPIAGLTSNLSSIVSNIPLIGGLLATAIDGFSNLLDFAVGATSKIQEMGREIGLSKVQAMALNNQFSNFAISTGKAYINSEKLFKTQIELTKQLGINNQISKNNLVTYYELNKFLGVDAQTQAEIEKTSRLTGRSAKDIAVSVMGQVKGLQKATGISLNFQQVLKEASSLSGYLGLQFAKYPEKLTKSLLTTKALGLELKTLDSMADSFLDFESSIGKEFEAQLLTGKEVNLSKARELFLNNKLADAALEISKQVGTSSDFLKQDRIAAEAWAATFGMSRDQMGDFLKQQEINAKFGVGSTKELQKQVALMRQQGNAQEAINKLGSEEAYNKLVTASASEDISGFIDKIKQSFADLVANTNLSDVIQNFIKFLASPDKIVGLVTKIKNVFGTIVGVMGSIFAGIMKAINLLSGFTGFTIPQSVITMTKTAGEQIKSLDVGNLLDYKKKDGIKEAEALEAKKEKNKVASVSITNAVKESPYKLINDIDRSEDKKMVSIDQYKQQQMSISDIKSKKDLESYDYKQDFKDLKDAMAKNNSQPINVNVQNVATGPTAGAIGTAISIYGPSESSRNFASNA
jgi:hypothetical protein